MARIESLNSRRSRKASCPICQKPPAAEFKPLCSSRCKKVDLGRWLGETYAIQSEEEPDEAELIDLMTLRSKSQN